MLKPTSTPLGFPTFRLFSKLCVATVVVLGIQLGNLGGADCGDVWVHLHELSVGVSCVIANGPGVRTGTIDQLGPR